ARRGRAGRRAPAAHRRRGARDRVALLVRRDPDRRAGIRRRRARRGRPFWSPRSCSDMKNRFAIACACAGLSLGSCGLTSLVSDADGKVLEFQPPATGAEAPKLYARDGSVVSAAPPGSLEQVGQPASPPQADAGSRVTVIELLQQAVAERDRLR